MKFRYFYSLSYTYIHYLAEEAMKAEKASQRKLLREAIAAKEHEELLSGDTAALKAKLAALEAEEE